MQIRLQLVITNLRNIEPYFIFGKRTVGIMNFGITNLRNNATNVRISEPPGIRNLCVRNNEPHPQVLLLVNSLSRVLYPPESNANLGPKIEQELSL